MIRHAAKTWLRLRYLAAAQPVPVYSEMEKREHILSWQRATGHQVFVETGTYLGKTALAVSPHFRECYTIEYDKSLYERALVSFAGRANITAYHGDSGEVIGLILKILKEPALFWLDAHYCGGTTARISSDKFTPIEQELKQIFAHPIKNHLILIDDAREFLGRKGYPTLQTMRELVSDTTPYTFRLLNDIIRIYREDI